MGGSGTASGASLTSPAGLRSSMTRSSAPRPCPTPPPAKPQDGDEPACGEQAHQRNLGGDQLADPEILLERALVLAPKPADLPLFLDERADHAGRAERFPDHRG